VRVLVFSKPQFDQALDTAPAFRRFVFQNLGRRLTEVVARMEEVAFRPVDRRLAGLLLDRADQTGRVIATHQAVSVEVGSAREVVSRLLKRLESAGLVRLGRSTIQVVDRPGLERLAGRRVT
jgi:CRP/FNR family transcriptional regulator